jgi:protoporphyrinogen IX oxidase
LSTVPTVRNKRDLPRLFVYHCEAEAGSKQSETFKLMERRLLKAIINPAMTVT